MALPLDRNCNSYRDWYFRCSVSRELGGNLISDWEVKVGVGIWGGLGYIQFGLNQGVIDICGSDIPVFWTSIEGGTLEYRYLDYGKVCGGLEVKNYLLVGGPCVGINCT